MLWCDNQHIYIVPTCPFSNLSKRSYIFEIIHFFHPINNLLLEKNSKLTIYNIIYHSLISPALFWLYAVHRGIGSLSSKKNNLRNWQFERNSEL
jgi:hypothetical protein